MISRRALELATAVLTGSFGVTVVVSSLDNGIGWSSAGVDAGTFPFIVGVLIFAGSLYNLVVGWPGNQAILLRPVSVAQIEAVAEAGERMPQKTTFFQPKPLTGLVFRSLDLG